MGRVRVFIASSVDGFIAGPDDELDWLSGREGVEDTFTPFMEGVGAMLMGRRTYDVVAGFDAPWPYGATPVLVATSRAMEPKERTVRAVHGYILICADRTDEARSLLEATVAMDPEHPLAHWFLGQLHFRNGDYGRAVESLRVASSLSEEASRMMADLASALALNGDRDAAQNLLANLKRRSRPEEGVSSYEYAIVYTGLGDMAQAIFELEAAMEERTWQVVYMGIDPMLGPLRESDRYSDLLLQLGLPSD